MNMAQIHAEAIKEDKRRSQTALAVADLRQRIDTNAAILCAALRSEHADEVFAFEDQRCPVRDLPHWAFVEWLNTCYSTEYDARLRVARMRSIEAIEKHYGVFLKDERTWYAYLEER